MSSAHAEQDLLIAELTREFNVAPEDVRIVRSPYRICPLGAHIDHQLGKVTALAIDRAVYLAFTAIPEPECRIHSWTFPGEVRFGFSDVGPKIAGDWGNYARGAVTALERKWPLPRGIVGLTTGSISEGGLSSSAAIGVAYLLALEAANAIDVTPWENVELDRLIENEYLGLRNGILDQAAILLSRRANLTVIDCLRDSHELIPLPAGTPEHAWLIASSGIRQPLVTTGYNRRVQECAAAARTLLEAAARSDTRPLLGNVTAQEYAAHGHLLAGESARRARHFFNESSRVNQGVEAWRRGDLVAFGRLMTESGRSSIEQYECGSPPLVDLYEVLISTPGVLGARFSGAGFRGCSIALVEAAHAIEAARSVEERYRSLHPEFAAEANVHICHSADGAAIL